MPRVPYADLEKLPEDAKPYLGARRSPQGNVFKMIANAGKAHINGAELALEYRPVVEWTFGGSLSLLESRLDQVSATVIAHKGDRLPGSAPVNLVGYIEHTQPIGDDAALFARVDAKYVGKEYAALKYIGSDAALVSSTSLTYG